MMRCAVVGNPVRHSLSPWLHAAFAKQTQCPMVYAAYQSNAENIGAFFKQFFAEGGAGLNITAPFKYDALKFADDASAFAQKAQAANVLMRREDGCIFACNTDGAGLIRDIRRNLNEELQNRRILLIGAGGAARAAALALSEQKPALLTIAARDKNKAAQLAEVVGDHCAGVALPEVKDNFDIVINATAAGYEGKAPHIAVEVFNGASLVYDMAYGENARPFLSLATAAKQGADGVGMLAEQAAASFAVWLRRFPTTAQSVQTLRAKTKNHWRKK